MQQKAIPLDEQVEGACEILGLAPLYVTNEGKFFAFVAADQTEAIVESLRTFAVCKRAVVVGKVVENHAGQVVLTSLIGGRRVVNMLQGEQLPRIC